MRKIFGICGEDDEQPARRRAFFPLELVYLLWVKGLWDGSYRGV